MLPENNTGKDAETTERIQVLENDETIHNTEQQDENIQGYTRQLSD
jgi:hypothetical protein